MTFRPTRRRVVIVGNGIAGRDRRRDPAPPRVRRRADHRRRRAPRGVQPTGALQGAAPSTRRRDLPPLPPPDARRHRTARRASRRARPRRRSGAARGGERLPFDGLVIATGSRARVGWARRARPPAELTLRGLDDARELRRRIASRPSVVVIGGGPLGMEIASGAPRSGLRGDPGLTRSAAREAAGRPTSPGSSSPLRGSRGLRTAHTGAARLARARRHARVAARRRHQPGGRLVVARSGDRPNLEWLATAACSSTAGSSSVDSRAGSRAPDRRSR